MKRKMKKMLDSMMNQFWSLTKDKKYRFELAQKPQVDLDKVLNNCWASRKNEVESAISEFEYNRPRPVTLIINYFKDGGLRTLIENHTSIRGAMEKVVALREDGIYLNRSYYGMYEMYRAQKPIDLLEELMNVKEKEAA